MKILVIGSGGREHALAWKLSRSPRAHKIFVAPGNPGTAREPDLANVAITAIPELIEFVRKEQIGLTVVGPEAPLAAGIVDAFRAGDRSPLEELDATLATIEASNLNCWSHLDPERARAAAKDADLTKDELDEFNKSQDTSSKAGKALMDAVTSCMTTGS